MIPRYPPREPEVEGETRDERTRRNRRNVKARTEWQAKASERCSRCGYARVNVVHEQDPATAPEGLDYYAAMAAEMHEFVP